ncbi:MAG TPA: serine/threonine-protein kinase [Myxococcales bacterium]
MPAKDYGRYSLLKKLATGGMAEVFLARQKGLEGFEKLCVIKRILPHLADDQEFVTMFLNEARIAARFGHPNIAQIFDLGMEEGTYYIAMEYVHGEDLGRIMRQAWAAGTWLPLPITLRIIAQSCEGLNYAHAKTDERGVPLKVVHRDVSPQNVLVSFEGSAKIVDFGIARAADQVSTTRSGAIKGKFAYMSPEQASGTAVDHRSDQFAIGLVLYELLTGVRPFKRDADILTLKAAVDCDIPAPSLVAEVPKALDPIVMRALSRVADDRYPDTGGFQLALDNFIVQQGWTVASAHVAEFMRALFKDRLAKEAELGEPIVGTDSQGTPASGSFPMPKKVPTRPEFLLQQPVAAPPINPAALTDGAPPSSPPTPPAPEVEPAKQAWQSQSGIRPATNNGSIKAPTNAGTQPKRRATSTDRPGLIPSGSRRSGVGIRVVSDDEPEPATTMGPPAPAERRRSSRSQMAARVDPLPPPVEPEDPDEADGATQALQAVPPDPPPAPAKSSTKETRKSTSSGVKRTPTAEKKRRSVLYMDELELEKQNRARAEAVKPTTSFLDDDDDDEATVAKPAYRERSGFPKWILGVVLVVAFLAVGLVPSVRAKVLGMLKAAGPVDDFADVSNKASLFLETNFPVDVFLGKERLGATPLNGVLVPEGTLKLRLVNGNLGVEKEITVQGKGSTVRHKETFAVGRARFRSDKDCEVFIAGKRVAKANGPSLDYFEGTYDVECRNEGAALVGYGKLTIPKDRTKLGDVAFKLGPMK